MVNSIHKTLFIEQNNITLLVYELINDKSIILFHHQLEFDNKNFINQLSKLLIIGNSFLKEKIKEIEVIFMESNLIKIPLINVKFENCFNQKEILKSIYSSSIAKDYYVNKINFSQIKYQDDFAIVDGELLVVKNEIYKPFLEIIDDLGIKLLNVDNIFNFYSKNFNGYQLFIELDKENLIISEYTNSELQEIKTFKFNFDEIYTKLCNFYHLSIEQIKLIISLLAKNIIANDNNLNLAIKFNQKFLSLDYINAKDFQEKFNNYFVDEVNKFLLTFDLKNKIYAKYFVSSFFYNNLIKAIKINDFEQINFAPIIGINDDEIKIKFFLANAMKNDNYLNQWKYEKYQQTILPFNFSLKSEKNINWGENNEK